MINKTRKTGILFFTAALIVSVVACNPSRKFEKEEEDLINDYLSSNPNLSFEQKPSGLYYYSLQEGAGIVPVKSDTVYVKYTGKFLNGTVFDTNVGTADTLIFPAMEGWMIKGFDEGISYLKVGGKAILLLPSWLAYGTTGRYGFVNGYTPLMFDVELVKLKPGSGK